MRRSIKLHFVERFSEGDREAQDREMSKVFDLVPPEEAEVMYLGTIARVREAMKILERHPMPLVVYCWDYYLWNHGRGEWPYYANVLKSAALILVPSKAQQLRLKELLGLDSVVVHSGVPFYDAEVSDGNFILDPVRYYPEENEHWAEKAAEELGIPLIHSEHQFSYEEFKKLVASCSFLTCTYREASTGGLTLMEGLKLGKPSLVSNSPYMGARDYLEDEGFYFQYDDFEDLKIQMKHLWETRPTIKSKRLNRYTYKAMAKAIHKAICEHVVKS